MSRLWKVIFLAIVGLLMPTFAGSGIPNGDPYYLYVKHKNPKLKPREIASIINANRKYSSIYHVDMFWHLSKTGYEAGFNATTGETFIVGGHKYNSEPCYGIECLEVSTVKGMYPNLTNEQIKYRLLHDYPFAIECAYRLDYANQRVANRMGFKSVYQNRVVTIIIYNSGLNNWHRYHYNLAKYIKSGAKLEDLSVKDWKRLHLSFREIYSLNYYVDVTEEADCLEGFIRDAAVTPAVEATPSIAQILEVKP